MFSIFERTDKMKFTLFPAGIFLGALFLFLPGEAFADFNPSCPSIYGAPCPTGQLTINKTVQNPKTGEFVDALGSGDVTFGPTQDVVFRIEVKNTGTAELTNIQAEDRFPQNTAFVSGPGSFNTGNAVLTWNIDRLNPGESKFFQVGARVRPVGELPRFDLSCMTNFAQARKDNLLAQDTAVFCIQQQALKAPIPAAPGAVPVKTPPPVTELPRTGLPIAAWVLSGLLPAGLGLRRLSGSGKDQKDSARFIWQKREFSKD